MASINAVTWFARVKSTNPPPSGPLVITLNGTVSVTLNTASTMGGLYFGSPPDPNNAAGGVVLRKVFKPEIAATSGVKIHAIQDIILLVACGISKWGFVWGCWKNVCFAIYSSYLFLYSPVWCSATLLNENGTRHEKSLELLKRYA
jgi:hypothetical protein